MIFFDLLMCEYALHHVVDVITLVDGQLVLHQRASKNAEDRWTATLEVQVAGLDLDHQMQEFLYFINICHAHFTLTIGGEQLINRV